VKAIAEPVHKGRTTIVYVINIYDDEERLICISRCTMAVITK
ncbi:hotdog fold thioesterase, partial [Bacillus atrophaeus]